MTEQVEATGGETPRWHQPWRWEGHWWFWASAAMMGVTGAVLALLVGLSAGAAAGVLTFVAFFLLLFVYVIWDLKGRP